MEKNKKLLKTSIILIAIALVISMGTSFYLKLDKPVFLEAYRDIDLPIYDTGYYGDVEFHLRYITNANDTRMVNHIELPEVANFRGYANETGGFMFNFFNNVNGQDIGQQVGPYSIRTVYVQLSAHDVPVTDEEFHLTKARVYFNNGEEMDIDLGELVFYGYRHSGGHLDFRSGSGSSDGTSSTHMKALKDITLINVESPLLSKFKYLVDLKINSTDIENISGMELKLGDDLNIFSKFSTPEDILLRFNDYDIHPKLNYKDSEGNTYTHRFRNVDYRSHSFELKEMIKYLRARGEL